MRALVHAYVWYTYVSTACIYFLFRWCMFLQRWRTCKHTFMLFLDTDICFPQHPEPCANRVYVATHMHARINACTHVCLRYSPVHTHTHVQLKRSTPIITVNPSLQVRMCIFVGTFHVFMKMKSTKTVNTCDFFLSIVGIVAWLMLQHTHAISASLYLNALQHLHICLNVRTYLCHWGRLSPQCMAQSIRHHSIKSISEQMGWKHRYSPWSQDGHISQK
jgi:hypothetical protein